MLHNHPYYILIEGLSFVAKFPVANSDLRSNHDLTFNTNLENSKKSSVNAKDVEKSTFVVDVQEKREIFEGKQDDHENKPKFRQGDKR